MKNVIQHNISLKPFNTFGIEAIGEDFIEIESIESLIASLKANKKNIQILGGGSNILFTKNEYAQLFIKNSIKGIDVVSETDDEIQVAVGSGENWHQFVMAAVDKGWGGIENLSLIPGTVGASPIQNIGAYGVEIKDVFLKLEALNLQTFDIESFTKADCEFGYRDSIFKRKAKGQYFITKVYFRLTKKNHKISTQYGDILKILSDKNITEPTIKDVSEAVISIRQSKLPDPSVIGNAGSFFKNPEIPKDHFDKLKTDFPNIVGYNTEGGVKLAAGWLIEQCGWKGRRLGNVGVHERQALVLVNYGEGKGDDIKNLSEKIQASVFEKFGVELIAEVNFL